MLQNTMMMVNWTIYIAPYWLNLQNEGRFNKLWGIVYPVKLLQWHLLHMGHWTTSEYGSRIYINLYKYSNSHSIDIDKLLTSNYMVNIETL